MRASCQVLMNWPCVISSSGTITPASAAIGAYRRPRGAPRGLRYAPIAALAGVIVPELLMTQGQFISTWQDARIFAVLAGLAWYYWRRDLLGTIIVGMAVYLPLHVGLGW